MPVGIMGEINDDKATGNNPAEPIGTGDLSCAVHNHASMPDKLRMVERVNDHDQVAGFKVLHTHNFMCEILNRWITKSARYLTPDQKAD